MDNQNTFEENIARFNAALGNISIDLPKNYMILNPYSGEKKELINKMSAIFYRKFFNDTYPRKLILGSSPARRGSAVTGIPFEDIEHLQQETGIKIDGFRINQASSSFLYEVVSNYGGIQKFYSDFYMNFVCPLGIVQKNSKGNYVNCNYYENKNILSILLPFLVDSLHKIISFGIDTSVCYCIGSGENYKVLRTINDNYKFFKKIIPLEHPRYITQYHSEDKYEYLNKYMQALSEG
ncbi:DUF4918 family protein [Lactiplantibacillus sp. WILCCON 0030]|uniref:DUF4918 family protein n=1 Tax=Lactiplantibacillus brownii TaxID=3069269 RepID=A0ABU1AB75_9LACO|nr:uracil-DNA glycosylase family protein [Lactiplantibacillus brownii]MDQ7938179.1 DUF4918 family protein [Lactiplantibacillus brownii]